MTDALDLEIEALSALDNAQDYNSGIDTLKQIYSTNFPEDTKDPEAAKVLSDYGDKLFYKFKQPLDAPEDLVQIAPIKPNEVTGDDDVERVNNWEEANLKYLEDTDDLDQIAYKNPLSRQIKAFASDARRDVKSSTPGLWGEIVDKDFRLIEGALGPLASAAGYDEVGKFFHEYTKPENDETLASALTSTAGAVIPALLAEAATAGGATPVLLTQTWGATRAAYNRYIEATGDEEKAQEGAGLTLAGQAIGFIPLARAAGGIFKAGAAAEATAAKAGIEGLLDTLKPMGVAKTAAKFGAEGAVGGAAGQVISNVGEAIGTDRPVEITQGLANAAISNAILGGGIGGVHALLNDVSLHQFKETLKEAHKVHKEHVVPTFPESKAHTKIDPAESTELVDRPDGAQAAHAQQERSRQSDMSPFTRDSDGHFVLKERSPDDYDRRVEETEDIYNEVPETLKEQVDPLSHPTDEAGQPITPSTGEDTFVATPDEFLGGDAQKSIAGNIIVSDAPNAIKPNRFTTWLAQKIFGSNITLQRNVSNGAFGAFYPRDHSIKILRSLGSDPNKLSETLAHEIGHLVDAYVNKAFTTQGMKQLGQKLTGLKLATDKIAGGLVNEGRAISQAWRPGWDGSNGKARGDSAEQFAYYRAKPEEVFADVFSAVINAPDWVRENFPGVMKALEEHLSTHPEVAEAWKTFQSFELDPSKISEFDFSTRLEARKQQGVLQQAAMNAKNRTMGQKLKEHLDQAYQFVFDRYAPAKEAFSKLTKESRELGYDILNNLTRKDYVEHFIKRAIDEPLKNVMSKVLQGGIDLNDWAQFEWANRVINESTPTIERIKEDPEQYQLVAAVLKEFLYREKGVHVSIVDKIFDPNKLETTEGLIQAFASLHLIGDTAQPLSRSDFEAKVPLTDPHRERKITARYKYALKSLAKRDVSIPIENLKKFISDLENPNLRALMEDVTTPGAFAVRKYLVNTGGTTIFDAQRDISHLQTKLGDDKFRYLTKQSAEYHTILSKALPIIKEAGILTPEMFQRMAINKDNYVVANVLKYFEGDDSIDTGIHTAVGSLNDIGNELNSTSLKMKAFIERSYYQRALNSAIQLAEATNQVVEVFTPKWGESIFDKKKLLADADKDHSYMIGYKAGKPAIYKIAGGKSFEKMFTSQKTAPVLGFFLDIADKFNNLLLTRQLKTSLSPSFILNQKLMDRKWEVMMANAVGATKGLPVNFGLSRHSSSKLREMDTASIAEIKHFKKTGELTGSLKKLLDLDGAALELHYGDPGTIPYETSFEHAIYEAFGTDLSKVPEAASTVGRVVQQTEGNVKAIGDYLQNNKASRALSGIANFDELRTKINGFQIGKAAGMTDTQAASFARERFGNPDPLAGGIAAPMISRMFLFGRAHINGLRNLKDLLKQYPRSAAVNATLLMMPKLMGATAVMVPVLRSIYGDDTADKYQKMVEMIPENEWITKSIVPLGFQDSNGNIRMFHDVKAAEIGPDWKAFYSRGPQTHEFTAMSRVLWPMFKELYQGDVAGAGAKGLKGGVTTAAANIQPVFRYAEGLFTLLQGGNPIDQFRQKPIISKDVALAGSPLQKAGEYGAYVGSQQFGSVIPYNPFRTTEPKGALETAIQKVPLAGPMIRTLVGISNYGNAEKDKDIQAERDQEVSRIRMSVDDTTHDLLQQYTIAKAQTTAIGKGWKAKVPPQAARQISSLTAWHTKIWTPYKNELLAAKTAGDSERYNMLLNSLEKYSQQLKQRVAPVELTLEEDNEKKAQAR